MRIQQGFRRQKQIFESSKAVAASNRECNFRATVAGFILEGIKLKISLCNFAIKLQICNLTVTVALIPNLRKIEIKTDKKTSSVISLLLS